jgi:hypothetical protein
MRLSTLQKLGGISLMLGSLMLLVYSIFFPLLLPMNEITSNFTALVLSPHWIWILTFAFIGVFMMIFGFSAVYSKLYSEAGIIGILGFIFIEIAFIIQACKISWEIFLWPVIASYQESMFLLKDFVLKNSALVGTLRGIASVTIFLGMALFCLALFRSRSFPKTGGILIFLGALLYGAGPILSVTVSLVGVFILSIGCTITGLSMFKRQV